MPPSSLRLPLPASAATQIRQDPIAPAGSATRHHRVLLVEDNPVDAMRIRQLLTRARSAAIEVDSTASVTGAHERLVSGSYDLVLLDLDLPDGVGLETYTTLAAVANQAPIVILSRPDDEEQALEAVRAGAQDVILKPFLSAEGLARTIRCAIERQRVVASLRGLSLTDELTGLFNRRGFTTVAQGHLRLANRTGNRFVLFFIDLDGLKLINDRHGHAEGDLAIVRVAEVLRTTFRQSDVLARFGGDEFVVLALDGTGDLVGTIERRLAAAVAEENGSGRGKTPISFSVGTIPFDGQQSEPLGVLLAKADRALYTEKRARSGR